MRYISKETELGFKYILLMAFLYFIQQLLFFTLRTQYKWTNQQARQQKQA